MAKKKIVMRAVRTNERITQEKIRKGMQDHHDEYVANLKREHERRLLDAEPAVYEIQQNNSEKPLVLGQGIIVLPGHYYVDTDEQTFGIAPMELEANYEQVNA